MVHHLFKHATKHAAKFYAANPHKVMPHAAAAVQVGSMVWTHGPRVAKHTAKFMAKAVTNGFNLFRS
jgi:hypothetical protein